MRALLSCLAFLVATVAPARAAPNILFILSDDQSYETLGSAEVETPHLDRLAARSTEFTHAYNMGSWSGAVCVASRHMLITGLSVWRAEEASKKLDATFRDRGTLWPQLMAEAGYRTYFSGKWHINTDPATCFDVSRNKRPGMPNQTNAGYDRPPADGSEDSWSPYDPAFEGFWKGGKHWSEVLGDDGVDFLGAAAEDDAPFFIYLAFNAPHDPRQSPREFVDLYPRDEVGVPADFLPEYPFAEAMKSGRDLRDEKLAPFPRTEEAVRVHRQEYFALITHMDVQIGRILAALDASGKTAETVVVFTSDHGLAVGHHGLMGKQNMFDHSVRVPFLVAGPGIPEGEKVGAPIYLQDVMPTTLELAGATVPEHVEFRSLVPFLDGTRSEAY
ncbi:sulfatase-like hydrolase/transferase [soil metagenome]